MSKKPSPTLIGVFTLAGLLLGGTALVLFGAGKFLAKTSKIQLYFDKSADGLLVGSEVRFAGVRIGRVKSINVLIDSKDNRKIIPIIVELSLKDLKAVGSTSGEGIDMATEAGVQRAVAEGLRARMKQQSFVTGQLNIEFDIMPTAKVLVFEPAVKPEFPTVPTIGTELDALISGITDGMKKLDGIDFGGMMKELRDTLTSARTKIEDLKVKEISDNLVGIAENVRVLTGNAKLTSAIDSMDEALKSFDSLAKKADQGFDPLLKDIEKVMQQATDGLAKLQEASADISKVTNHGRRC